MCTIDTNLEIVQEHCGDNNCKDLTDLCLFVELDTSIATATRFIGRARTKKMVKHILNSMRLAEIDAERTQSESRS
jgi:hypothetical protein